MKVAALGGSRRGLGELPHAWGAAEVSEKFPSSCREELNVSPEA